MDETRADNPYKPATEAHETRSPAETEHTHRDMLSQRGAMALARRLERYWHGEGYPAARFWAEPIDERFAKGGTYEIYRVVCNLVDGLPPTHGDRTGRSALKK